MKILLYGINFAPEPVGVGRYTGEMAAALKAAGHEVRVISALPYYPEWKVAAGYAPRRYAHDTWQGIPVWRAPLWVPFRPGGRKRILHLLSFAVTSLPLLVRQMVWRPDVVWMAAPAFVCAPAALVTAKLTGAKAWMHVQDFEVDIAFGMGLISGSGWKRFVYGCERWLMRRFDHVSTISRAMVGRARDKGIALDRLSLVPNWADLNAVKPQTGPNRYRTELSIPQTAVVALYSGTMGVKQGVDWVAEAAVALQHEKNLYFVLCGDGALKDQAFQTCGHLESVRFLPLQPLESLGDLLSLGDIQLLPQRQDAAEMVMPSKLTGMLASGRPVVGMATVGSELADVVQACGTVVPHGDVAAFAQAISHLASQPDFRVSLGQQARIYADQHFAATTVLAALERQMVALAASNEQTVRGRLL
jgi:colanic acid biosynthesis glycosyl transferase WcaI